jgi:hypothetical protein
LSLVEAIPVGSQLQAQIPNPLKRNDTTDTLSAMPSPPRDSYKAAQCLN